MIEVTKGIEKYVFEKRYEHFLLFRLEDEDGKVVYRETFRDVAEAQANIRPEYKVDWGELISEIDTDRIKTEINQEKLYNVMGLKHE